MKQFLSVFFFFLFFFTCSTNVYANSNFSTSYDATYTVDEEGISHVIYVVSLTNKTTEYFASSYKIKIGLFSLTNIKAKDSAGQITPTVEKTEDGQTIGITFNKKVVGVGQTQTFTLSFDTREIAEKQGSIWEINIPGLKDQKNFNDFLISVRVPKSFGPPTYTKPNIDSVSLDFNKELLGEGGISIAFGETQYYSFSLKYHLENSGLFTNTKEIALPPTTNYQTVIIDSITPKPIHARKDIDGNWLAQYKLSPSQNITVTVTGRAVVNLIPTQQPLDDSMRKVYTTPKQYWENNEKIAKLAHELKTPKNIYDYVVKHLIYDFSRVTANSPRLGAKNVLDNPNSAVCLEFTDLFVALSRAAGIPAREIDGFAYAQNTISRPISLVKDILHAWPEYYDDQKQTWIMVDPTWGNTTAGIDYFYILDFDHFAFVKKGLESTSPIPAGGYKSTGFENAKDVSVSFTEPFDYTNNQQLFLTEGKTISTIQIGKLLMMVLGGILIVSIIFIVLIATRRTRHLSSFR